MLYYTNNAKCPDCGSERIIFSTNSKEGLCRDCGERIWAYQFINEYDRCEEERIEILRDQYIDDSIEDALMERLDKSF